MVLTYLFENMGWWNTLAPKSRNAKRQKQQDKNNNDVESESATQKQKEQCTQEQQREENPEIAMRRMQLESQRQRELEAESRGAYIAKQRVKYHYRAMDSFHDAVILGVHLDDGPDKPYYTIQYQKADVTLNEHGHEEASLVQVEKQTTPDRLQRVPWDEEATWSILSSKKV
mmetsp:Transcript_31773/g.48737  ORF Transcript_31773/g.48737 Transcript_31773/m.48737 type:complete len:172 (-) Transcript_31773:68-583(-)